MNADRLASAFRYAAQLHARHRHKGSRIPYIAHLMAVASIVIEHGGGEDQAIAALLHDATEDQPQDGRTRKEIRKRFGPRENRLGSQLTIAQEDVGEQVADCSHGCLPAEPPTA